MIVIIFNESQSWNKTAILIINETFTNKSNNIHVKCKNVTDTVLGMFEIMFHLILNLEGEYMRTCVCVSVWCECV